MKTAKAIHATPLPWRAIARNRKLHSGRGEGYDIMGDCSRSPEWQEIVCDKASEPDAELIVHAVNCHADLVAACRAFIDSAEHFRGQPAYIALGEHSTPGRMARTALAKSGVTP